MSGMCNVRSNIGIDDVRPGEDDYNNGIRKYEWLRSSEKSI